MPTIRDVSRLANVSVATVSRVINANQPVSADTKARVVAAMAELGYQPNSNAKALATNRSDILGMVLGDLGGPFFGDLMAQAEEETRRLKRHLLVTAGGHSRDIELEAIDFLLRRQVDALMLHVDSLTDADLYELSTKTDTPIVLINRYVPDLHAHCIHVNNEVGGELITRHLIEQGHEAIACITGPLYKGDSRGRLQGYRRALEQAGLPYVEQRVVESDYMEAGGSEAIERLLSRKTPFTAVVCGNDLMAFGAIRSLRLHGFSVPQDIDVTGYDDIVLSSYVEPSLTTIHVPIGAMGVQAARLAVQLATGQRPTAQQAFEPQLVVRGSTRSRSSDQSSQPMHSKFVQQQ
ncbi:MAG: LacI family DNA-binding transcriptional regulator [Natronospirillum sp.]|uniref:LacI family DNA-binding transcriptional regulator n=1 Tax=Natronospirillum sp. TaxID=2812955 RepID=UPI0025D00117|nr:LacI family DNA-binding transcriptional regulator [Natronospirillum sp.]MCH8551932.1 LacI family DNA-binding transcriptional regulator [Natronospirillum sp.]